MNCPPTSSPTRSAPTGRWKHVVPQLLAQPNVTVLITFDEGGLDQGEHIATLLVGAGVTPGSTDNTLY